MSLEDFLKREREWGEKTHSYLSNHKLFVDSELEFDGYVTTSIVVDEVRIDFILTYDEIGDKPVVRISSSSPNKRGAKGFKVTGKNTTPSRVANFLINKVFKKTGV
jgi:hypothetical protein